MIALGLASTMAEGLGIGLLIPLLQELGNTSPQAGNGNLLGQGFTRLFETVPAERRTHLILACIAGAVLVRAGLTFAHGAINERIYAKVTHRLRSDLFRQLLTIGYRYIQQSKAGTLINTLATETWRSGDALNMLLTIAVNVGVVFVYVALLLMISWKLTLAIILAMLVFSRIAAWMITRTASLGRETNHANATLAQLMFQCLDGMKVIRIFGREVHEQKRFDATSWDVSHIYMKIGLFNRALEPLYELLVLAMLIVILLFSLSKTETLPSVLVFIVLLYRLLPKVKQLETLRIGLSSFSGAVGDVSALLDPAGKPVTRSGSGAVAGLKSAIEFDRVTFYYGGSDMPALTDVSLRIPAGKTTAIVGRSGSGKSSLINLILRLHDPTVGEILADGRALHSLDLAAWRSGIAVVSQDIYMFNDTVSENIAYGVPGASPKHIVEAAKLAHAHDFIEALPRGYDTVVGERGVRLSGGEQQRVTLARAILRDPAILILDEATNALDSISEHFIQKALTELSQNRTVIVIAHRLSTMEHADHVVVLASGRVVEQGTVPELVREKGLFARMHERQGGGAVS